MAVGCTHQAGASYTAPRYCAACWKAVLARGLSAEEWAALHAEAKRQPRGTRLPRPPKLPPTIKAWRRDEAEVLDRLTAAITKSMQGSDTADRCAAVVGQRIGTYRIVATDGCRLLAVPGADPGLAEQTRLREYLTAPLGAIVPYEAACQLAARRVMVCANARSRALYLTRTGSVLDLRASDPDGWDAHETVSQDGPPVDPAVAVTVNGDWLLEAAGAPAQLGLGTAYQYPYVRITATSGAWILVIMGML